MHVPTIDGALRRLGLQRLSRAEQRVADLRQRVQRQRTRIERLQTRVARLEQQRDRLRDRVAVTTAVKAIPDTTRLELRRQQVLASSPADALILEIGPAHNAILPKRDGYRTRTVDYLDRAGLIERYKNFPQYDPNDIEEVDYVLPPGAAMADVIHDRFDVVVASHVLEHTTSMIDFLNECERLLAPGGVLALVVPDHRYCFDRFRERASIARVIDASLNPPSLHTLGTVIEERLNAVRLGETTAWFPGHTGDYRFVHDLDSVLKTAAEARRAERYIDTHNWICTPQHLRLLLDDLYHLGFIRLRETTFHDTVRHEFFLNLSLDGAGPGLSREELMRLADDERRVLDRAAFTAPEDADRPA